MARRSGKDARLRHPVSLIPPPTMQYIFTNYSDASNTSVLGDFPSLASAEAAAAEAFGSGDHGVRLAKPSRIVAKTMQSVGCTWVDSLDAWRDFSTGALATPDCTLPDITGVNSVVALETLQNAIVSAKANGLTDTNSLLAVWQASDWHEVDCMFVPSP